MLTENKYANTLLPSNVVALIVAKLKVLRRQRKFTQQELSALSGVSLGSIKRFERTGKIAFDSLLKIAHVLGRLHDFKDIFNYDVNLDKVKSKFTK